MGTVVRIDSSKLEAKKAKIMDKIGYLVENAAIDRCPVEKGNMRAKITHKVEGDMVWIGTVGVPYARWVEEGTVIMVAAHGEHDFRNPVTVWEALKKRGGVGQTMPFLRTGAFAVQNEILKVFREELK